MSFCLWLTGLPGSGKSTILNELSQMLTESGIEAITLNLDHIRKVLTPQPKYTSEERDIVYRSLVIMAQLLLEHGGKNVIIDATGNRKEFRELARRLIREFAEIYVKCPLRICQTRETSRRGQLVERNLYKKAVAGRLIGQLPGISTPYEESEDRELEVLSNVLTPHESAKKIMDYVMSRWTG
ncbi:MAG: adenylyl-sulfate kinase [Desulfobacterales bacterium]|nr:adenylyl-sulfate kinase [Desulfobacterales bacterium]